MALQRILAKPPSQDDTLNAILGNVHAYNARQPRLYVGIRDCSLDAEMPLLLNPREAALACRETPEEFEAINAHFSAQVHAFFNALHTLEDMANKQSADELALIRPDDGVQPIIRIINQSFDIYPDCLHRTFHTRRLTAQDPETLPLLHRATKLTLYPAPDYASGPWLSFAHARPVSPRVPLELATRLPNLRELDCPWLWERLPIAFASRALRRFARPWEGPWRDARVDFARAVREVMPLLPSSLTKARLWFWKPNPYGDDADQSEQMPNLVDAPSSTSEFEGMDPVSLGLRDLATRLEDLDICALITPDLFSSGDDSATASLPSLWPHMQHLKVEFHPCAPDGRWYFSGPRGENPHPTGFAVTREAHYPPSGENDADEATHALWSREEDEHADGGSGDDICDLREPDMFRTQPIGEHIKPLLLAFALSLQPRRMPVLEDAELFTWLTWRPSDERAKEYEGSEDVAPSREGETVMFRWGVRYDAPKGDGKGKVTWQIGEDWRPGDEVIEAFEELVGGEGENVEWQAFEYVEERERDPEDFI